MLTIAALLASVFLAKSASAQEICAFSSPNGQVKCSLQKENGAWTLTMADASGNITVSTPLGFTTDKPCLSGQCTFVSASAPEQFAEEYTAIHGKKSQVKNEGNKSTVLFRDPNGCSVGVEVRLYNDGAAFRYVIADELSASFTFTSEATAFHMPAQANRWIEAFVTSYEGDFPLQQGSISQGAWNYPALFEVDGTFALLTEAGIDGTYCSTHLDNSADRETYAVSYPFSWEGNNTGDVNPSATGPWKSPWRVLIMGDLATLVESTLVEDVCEPCALTDTSWIQPGRASWIYWAYNHGTKDYQTCCDYVDLAAEMGWEYVLFDWEWDAMTNGGNLEDAAKYAASKGIKPLMWYNSGGTHNTVSGTPRDRMLTHANRVAEFTYLNKIGIAGVKIDFFESDKQSMMQYYLDILKDAADYHILVNFHGCTLPRGWSRTYPHLISMEAVYGAEQYNNTSNMTAIASRLNCTLPFTRNVVGPMDYTPVAFTNSQNPHTTSFAHELALSVAFESGVQHWADRPSGFRALTFEAKRHMQEVPVAWDETKFIDGYPGESFVVARRSGENWYVAGLNGEKKAKDFAFTADFLPEGQPKMATILADGTEYDRFQVRHQLVSSDSLIRVHTLEQGGFTIIFSDITLEDLQQLL